MLLLELATSQDAETSSTGLRFLSLLGIFVILAICYAFSHDRRAISWRLIGGGLVLQAVLGVTFLYWQTGNDGLQWLGDKVKEFLDLAKDGTDFVFGPLAHYRAVDQAFPDGLPEYGVATLASPGLVFATQVLPTLIFFSAVMAVLYYLGVMQLVVRGMAWIMARLLGTSGSESLSACGNIFVGQTEAPLMVRPFLPRMTLSEIHAVMTGGFATIAGGVFALYVGMGIEPGHLMVASVMAVPAGLMCTKMLWPETEESETMGKVVRAEVPPYGNVVEAAAAGAGDGLKLALNVAAMLIAFLGLVAVLNWILGGVSGDSLSVELILGYAFYPVAAVMGVQGDEIFSLSELLGTKIAMTELVAYQRLGGMSADLSPRTFMIASFALCGFANLGSVAIQIGGLGGMAPERRGDIARLSLRAMCAGALATCMTACVAGVLASAGAS